MDDPRRLRRAPGVHPGRHLPVGSRDRVPHQLRGRRPRLGRVVRQARALRPARGPGVRVDTHGFPGYKIPPYYDSLLAKVIVHADSREEALARMDRALAEFDCAGVSTTIPFHRELMSHSTFREGTHRLDFVDRFLTESGTLREAPVE
ncbi:hypothetical protein ACFQV2_34365 [Actinokineospora soli]|uniref:biotin carboxylase n=1 Tax=Actinokineospora soli TaxID=1048753 RepID=A0ABW2TWK8_9PSEU